MNKCKFLGLINLQVPREGKKKKKESGWPGKLSQDRKQVNECLSRGSDFALFSSHCTSSWDGLIHSPWLL